MLGGLGNGTMGEVAREGVGPKTPQNPPKTSRNDMQRATLTPPPWSLLFLTDLDPRSSVLLNTSRFFHSRSIGREAAPPTHGDPLQLHPIHSNCAHIIEPESSSGGLTEIQLRAFGVPTLLSNFPFSSAVIRSG